MKIPCSGNWLVKDVVAGWGRWPRVGGSWWHDEVQALCRSCKQGLAGATVSSGGGEEAWLVNIVWSFEVHLVIAEMCRLYEKDGGGCVQTCDSGWGSRSVLVTRCLRYVQDVQVEMWGCWEPSSRWQPRDGGTSFPFNWNISPVWLRVVCACLKFPTTYMLFTCSYILIQLSKHEKHAFVFWFWWDLWKCSSFFTCVSIILKAAIKPLVHFVLKIRTSYRLLINTGNAWRPDKDLGKWPGQITLWKLW